MPSTLNHERSRLPYQPLPLCATEKREGGYVASGFVFGHTFSARGSLQKYLGDSNSSSSVPLQASTLIRHRVSPAKAKQQRQHSRGPTEYVPRASNQYRRTSSYRRRVRKVRWRGPRQRKRVSFGRHGKRRTHLTIDGSTISSERCHWLPLQRLGRRKARRHRGSARGRAR